MPKNKEHDHRQYPNWIDPNEVTPYEKNAKIHTEKQIKNICTSIRRFGWQQDTVLTSDNVLVIGHGRRLAALEIGCKMPYHRVGKNADELTDAEIDALRLADNKVAESGWDFTELEAQLAELSLEFDMTDFGFDDIQGGVFDTGFTDDFTLKDGDREPVQNMTFTFSDTEADVIKEAISTMKGTQRFKDYENPENMNGNGTALFLVADEWLRQRI